MAPEFKDFEPELGGERRREYENHDREGMHINWSAVVGNEVHFGGLAFHNSRLSCRGHFVATLVWAIGTTPNDRERCTGASATPLRRPELQIGQKRATCIHRSWRPWAPCTLGRKDSLSKRLFLC